MNYGAHKTGWTCPTCGSASVLAQWCNVKGPRMRGRCDNGHVHVKSDLIRDKAVTITVGR